ncbi:RluA family pseudouridine synthase [bacterium]|nr:RluA family pseudouridine synthase [bacterium]
MNAMKELKVGPKNVGLRLDVALSAELEAPRAQIQKLIKTDAVTVNGKAVTAHLLLREGDVVSFPPLPKLTKRVAPTVSLEILYEDKDVVVVNKPAGIIVHPMNDTDKRTSVIGSLLKGRAGLKKVGDSPLRPGIVHRLDRAVSGVMIVAKTNKAFDFLKEQFATRAVDKEYVALVYGKMPKDHGTIDFKIARSKHLGRMVSRPEGQEGKEALTEYDVLEQLKTVALVAVKIHTGRTHQIRTHFKALGHPVVGDTLYHTKIVHIRPIELDRLFLHAKRLSITLPDGSHNTFETELPAELSALLTTLPRK